MVQFNSQHHNKTTIPLYPTLEKNISHMGAADTGAADMGAADMGAADTGLQSQYKDKRNVKNMTSWFLSLLAFLVLFLTLVF